MPRPTFRLRQRSFRDLRLLVCTGREWRLEFARRADRIVTRPIWSCPCRFRFPSCRRLCDITRSASRSGIDLHRAVRHHLRPFQLRKLHRRSPRRRRHRHRPATTRRTRRRSDSRATARGDLRPERRGVHRRRRGERARRRQPARRRRPPRLHTRGCPRTCTTHAGAGWLLWHVRLFGGTRAGPKVPDNAGPVQGNVETPPIPAWCPGPPTPLRLTPAELRAGPNADLRLTSTSTPGPGSVPPDDAGLQARSRFW